MNDINDKTFCMAPWTHIQINAFGEINPCCMFNQKNYIKKYDNLLDAFYGEENTSLKNKMLMGKKISGCNKCYRDENLGLKSYRNRFNERYFSENNLKNPQIKELEIALGNKCNFKCVTCNSKFSSAWYKDDIALESLPGKTFKNRSPRLINTLNGPIIKNKINFDDFNSMTDLSEIKILGGEPFLDEDYIQIFKKINKKNITLFFVTNNSIFPNQEWIDCLREFKKVIFNISIDGINEVSEFVRYGVNFSKFEKNYKKWIDLSKNFENDFFIVPHFVFHNLNVLNFEETVFWLAEIHGKSNDDMFNYISFDFLESPEMLNISFLPDSVKIYILNNIKNLKMKCKIESFLNMKKFDHSHIKDFLKYCSFLNLRSNMPDQSLTILKKCREYV